MSFERVAVLRMDALGDTLLCTPALASLRRNWPACRLHLFASGAGRPVLESLGEVHTVKSDWSARRLAASIREIGPQAVVVLSEKRRAYQAAYLSGTSVRVGFDPGWTQPLKTAWLRLALTHRLPYPNDLERDPGMHEVERYQRLVELLGVPGGDPGPLVLQPSKADRDQAAGWLRARFAEAPVALQVTSKWCLDGWPPEWPGELLCRLPGPVLALCGPDEKDWAAGVLDGYGAPLGCFAELSLYAAVLGQCRLLVTPDTGAAHVAAAAGIPVIDVFREQHHRHCVRRWRPWKVSHRVLLKGEFRQESARALTEAIRQSVGELS